MIASLKNYRQSPRKVRLLADLVRGKSVSEALRTLAFTPKRASIQMIKLIKSAAANAKTSAKSAAQGASDDALFIQMVQVNKGVTLKRMMPRARGNSSKINKRCSNVTLILGQQAVKAPKAKKASKKENKPAPKTTEK